MRQTIISIILLFSILVTAQDDKQKNPNVELPDFIITGKAQLNVRKVDKVKPDFISAVSEDFLKPNYSPEELGIANLSDPIKRDLGFLDELSYFKGNVAAGVGVYTIPTVEANYAHPFTNGIVEGMFKGNFNRSYVDNSDRYNTRLGFNLLYWTDIDGEILPGTQFNVNGNYGTTSYKLFASNNPEQRRSLNSGLIEVGVKNNVGKYFIFGLNITDKVASISQEEFSENNFRLKAESRIKLSAVNIGVAADYRNHSIKNLSGDNSGKDFFLVRPTAGFQFTELIKGSFGFSFSSAAGNTYHTPYASVAIKLDKNFTLFGEYSPTPEFETPGSLLLKNNYFRSDSVGSIYWERDNAYKLSVKYEFGKYFQIDGGLSYFSSDAFPYYANSPDTGKFDLNYADMNSISPFINLLFYLGPYGEFYSTFELSEITDQNDKTIPYYSNFKVDAAYSYKFDIGLKTSARLGYYSKRYADIENEISLGDYIDLGLSFVYTYKPNLDFTLDINNLLNNKNFLWNGYKEIPLNVIFGINYRL
jgi:hypothetical protein